MPVYREEPVVVREEPVVEQPVVNRTDGGLTGFAIAKYGFILLMTIIILWFIANYLLPFLR
ncbi:MAG: hypothetical protein ACRDIU_03095 [Actinomycetota bacterium]